MFSRLTIGAWRQFEDLDLSFHQRLTVLTGANGSGKTTVLSILARHFDWPTQFLGVPYWDTNRVLRYASQLRRLGTSRRTHEAPIEGIQTVGQLTYANGIESQMQASESGSQVNFVISNQQPVDGLSIPSHRSATTYQPITQIPTQFNPVSSALQVFLNDVRNRYTSGGRSPLYSLKENLIAAAIYGEGNSAVAPNPEAREILSGFQRILVDLLPPSLGFERLYIQLPEIVIQTSTGDFALESSSGGLLSLIELAWQIYLRARIAPTFTVCFDEPENHLHPELQRQLLPRLLQAYPKVQFIIATHSALVCTSVRDSNVYVLRYGSQGHGVSSELLDIANRAGSAAEILRDVLGLSTTFPVWVEDRLTEIVTKYSQTELGPDDLEGLRDELGALGLGDLIPNTLAQVVEKQRGQR